MYKINWHKQRVFLIRTHPEGVAVDPNISQDPQEKDLQEGDLQRQDPPKKDLQIQDNFFENDPIY